MTRSSALLSSSAIALAFLLACASTTPLPPIAVSPVVPGPNQVLAVENLVVVVDTSGSLHRKSSFPQTKQVVEGFIAALPQGDYNAGLMSFGGKSMRPANLAPFNRASLADTAAGLQHGGGLSPIEEAIKQATSGLGEGPAAIVLFSDGLATRHTREVGPEGTLAVAEAAVEARRAPLCFYTVRVGDDEGGEALLRALAAVGGCGRFLQAANWTDGATLKKDVQKMMFAGAAGPLDTDRDGITDDKDQCPGTPIGASVEERGCWTLSGSNFATGSADLRPSALADLTAIAKVLEDNPSLRIQVEGHTDSTGSDAINQTLSTQRAEAVRTQLVKDGIASDRIEARGYGSSQPAASNGTSEGRAANRRVEIDVLR
ncbi:MAG: OmpA family protein [Myxococcota bacterium]|nr:OmpA family protein [Myxococcota bacterium]